MNLLGFDIVEGAGMDGLVNGFRSELTHGKRGASQGKQPVRAGQRHFVQGAGGDNAGDKQLEGRVKTCLSQLKQRRLWEGANRLTDARESQINIERAF
jgi:hypothetical protein